MCGAQWPESSVFSLFMNVSALLSAILCYFRFRQVQYFQTRCANISAIWKLNVSGLLFGLLSSLGLLIVANFQEARTPWPQVYFAHLTGALITFTAGIICAGIQDRVDLAIFMSRFRRTNFKFFSQFFRYFGGDPINPNSGSAHTRDASRSRRNESFLVAVFSGRSWSHFLRWCGYDGLAGAYWTIKYVEKFSEKMFL